MTGVQVLLIVIAAWFGAVAFGYLVVLPWLRHGPGRDPTLGVLWRVARTYSRLMHRPVYSGHEAIRRKIDAGGLVVVANHTGAADPLLLQSACRFHIRWMMAGNFMWSSLDWFWRAAPPIAVSRDGRDSGPLREAIRYVRSGHAIGIFPEGRIVHPRGQIFPFLPGAGLIVARSKAPVLLAWISGTPDTGDVMTALGSRSHARVEFLELIDYGDEKDANVIAQDLRRRLQEASGWIINDEPPPPPPMAEPR